MNQDGQPPTYGFRPELLLPHENNGPFGPPQTQPFPVLSGSFEQITPPCPAGASPQQSLAMYPSGVQLSYGAAEVIDDDGDDAPETYVPSNLSSSAVWTFQTATADVPHSAVRAGTDTDGTAIYVGRAKHEGDLLPAKVIPEKNVAYVSYGGQEHAKTTYEVLYQPVYMWEPASGGQVPPGAVEVGYTADGEKLYIGRTVHQGSQTPGKVQPSHGCMYFPFDGAEVSATQYEVLVLRQ